VITEQERYEALKLMSANQEGDPIFDRGLTVLLEYVMQEAAQNGEFELEFEEIHNRVNLSFAGHILSEMANKGLLDVSLDEEEITYTITELGKKLKDRIGEKGV
tara:strand:- start:27981 stop:28292 length:312 start_codon:yes stop_codon:yes gene_type:complete